MRVLLFTNYLEMYLRDVSGVDTVSIHKLTKLMKDNYRLTDALILYSALTNNQHLLNKYTNNKYKDVLSKLNKDNYLDDEFSNYEFRKIYSSYQSHINASKYDIDTKEKARLSILELMRRKSITKYRIYRDLNLNPGNINAYLRNNDSSKVSLNLVKRIYNYVVNY